MHKLEVKQTIQMEEKGRSIPCRHREEYLYPESLTMGIQFGPPHSLKTTSVFKHFLLGFCISRILSLYLTCWTNRMFEAISGFRLWIQETKFHDTISLTTTC